MLLFVKPNTGVLFLEEQRAPVAAGGYFASRPLSETPLKIAKKGARVPLNGVLAVTLIGVVEVHAGGAVEAVGVTASAGVGFCEVKVFDRRRYRRRQEEEIAAFLIALEDSRSTGKRG